ncbi:MAG: glycerophosphodiester phosphodiesterase family protein [Planctomycetota bacterium]|jgi:glycerophosphoryl diester phosphodiesterase
MSTFSILGMLCLGCFVPGDPVDVPIVIAHRGASGYVVEHTEAAKVLAHAQGADFIEQDVVLSKDRIFIVTHDITMEETTDAEDLYPTRARPDGHWYFADFTWEELQKLQMHERTHRNGGGQVFSDRFPGACGQRILRLEDEILLLRGLDATTGRRTGLYIELKSPAFHRREFGESMGALLLGELERQGIRPDAGRCYLQCFESEELEYLHGECECRFPLIQLVGRTLDQDALPKIAQYAAGIGPSLDLLMTKTDQGNAHSTGLVERARAAGLKVHPYTVRRESQPRWSSSLEQTHAVLLKELQVDGFFTDFPDLSRRAVDTESSRP